MVPKKRQMITMTLFQPVIYERIPAYRQSYMPKTMHVCAPLEIEGLTKNFFSGYFTLKSVVLSVKL